MQDTLTEIDDLSLTSANMQWLKVLVTEDGDVAEFVEILETFPSEGEAIQEFHIRKVDRSNVTEQAFVEQYRLNPIYALQSLFMYPIDLPSVLALEDMLHREELTLETLYKMHKKYPYRNLYRFIL